jgi:pimeloyl-ACP methyl ester carboxylesterase
MASPAKPVVIPPIKPGTSTSFGSLKQIDAGLLSVGYAEAGPPGGPAVILLHGWPYEVHSFADVTPALAAAGCRVLVPYVRGYGTTRFRLIGLAIGLAASAVARTRGARCCRSGSWRRSGRR